MSIIKTERSFEHAPTQQLRNIDNLARFSRWEVIFFCFIACMRKGESEKKNERKIFCSAQKKTACTHQMYVYYIILYYIYTCIRIYGRERGGRE